MDKPLTPTQQARVKAKVFKILGTLGFKEDFVGLNQYWWKQVRRKDLRVCVSINFPYPSGGTMGWSWQTATLKSPPLFGMAGSSGIAVEWGSVEKVINITLETFYQAGWYAGMDEKGKEVREFKDRIAMVLASL